jgi:hypothetical protein
MAAIDQIVSIAIAAQTTSVSQASFSVPLIVGPTATGWAGSDYVHTYSSPAGMLTDGFTLTSPEYIHALAMFSQAITPATFKVGKRGPVTAQVDTLAIGTLTAAHVYAITVNGVVCTYTAGGGDTQQAVLAALNTSIQAAAPVTGVVTGTGVSALLTLTSSQAGAAITYSSIDPLLTRASTTASAGIASDLASILAQDSTWYGLSIASGSDNDILQAAPFIEGNKKLFLAISGTIAISGASTTDVGSVLKAAGYKRTALLYSPANLTSGAASAWLGEMLATTPGSNNWAFKQLTGIAADTLTSTQVASLIGLPLSGTAGKNANIYSSVGGVSITQMGTTASGQYIDITVGLDWLTSQLQTNIYGKLANAAKIPYTDKGVALLMSAVRAALDQGVVNGLIDGDSAISVSAPSVLSVPSNQRANRIAPTISFLCRLQGAFNAISIAGTVTI